MSDPFVGEIRMFAGNFAPRGWAFCDGQLLAISQNTALFSLLGAIYGGDGRTTFGLPDMRSRIPIHQGSGPGLSPRPIGQKGGAERITLTTAQIPPHTHTLQASSLPANAGSPENRVPAETVTDRAYRADDVNTALGTATSAVGGNEPHTNMMPFLCVHFIIALFGVYPSRN